MYTKKRLPWPDVLRALALYAVVMAHLGSFSQRISLFCFGFVMQLFFFISGLFAKTYTKLEFGPMVRKAALHLLIPHVILSAVNIAYAAYKRIPGWQDSILQCVLAIRNRILYSTLWFLPCLFVMIVVYWCLCRLVRPALLRLILCAAVSLCFRIFKEPSQWFWSADTAMMYIFYFSLGDCMFPFLKDIPSSSGAVWKKILFGAVSVLSLIPTVVSYYVYNSTDPVLFGRHLNTLDLMIFMFVVSVFTIFVFVGLSFILQKARLLQDLGKSTILLFGTQGIAADLFSWVLWQVGITWIPRYGWQALIIGAARLLFSYLIFAVPFNAVKKALKRN